MVSQVNARGAVWLELAGKWQRLSEEAESRGTATAKEDRIGLAATCGVGDLSSSARRARSPGFCNRYS